MRLLLSSLSFSNVKCQTNFPFIQCVFDVKKLNWRMSLPYIEVTSVKSWWKEVYLCLLYYYLLWQTVFRYNKEAKLRMYYCVSGLPCKIIFFIGILKKGILANKWNSQALNAIIGITLLSHSLYEVLQRWVHDEIRNEQHSFDPT